MVGAVADADHRRPRARLGGRDIPHERHPRVVDGGLARCDLPSGWRGSSLTARSRPAARRRSARTAQRDGRGHELGPRRLRARWPAAGRIVRGRTRRAPPRGRGRAIATSSAAPARSLPVMLRTRTSRLRSRAIVAASTRSTGELIVSVRAQAADRRANTAKLPHRHCSRGSTGVASAGDDAAGFTVASATVGDAPRPTGYDLADDAGRGDTHASEQLGNDSPQWTEWGYERGLCAGGAGADAGAGQLGRTRHDPPARERRTDVRGAGSACARAGGSARRAGVRRTRHDPAAGVSRPRARAAQPGRGPSGRARVVGPSGGGRAVGRAAGPLPADERAPADDRPSAPIASSSRRTARAPP
jgi:hypothetical protein